MSKGYGRRQHSRQTKLAEFENTIHRQEYERILGCTEKIRPFAGIIDEFSIEENNTEKIAESTYAEVFRVADKTGTSVLKVVRLEGASTDRSFTPMGLSTRDIVHEIQVSSAVSGRKGFIQTKKIGLYRGEYPSLLLRKWEEFEKKENKHPEHYAHPDQVFVVFVFEDGGVELERFSFQSEAELQEVFESVLSTLAGGEEICFEHRDMHVSNILVRREHGRLLCSLIDFSLSALFQGKEFVSSDLGGMDFLFSGTEEHHRVYREMRASTGGEWSRHVPATNVLWLEYLHRWLSQRHIQSESVRDFFRAAGESLGCSQSAKAVHCRIAGT
ncbi:MAG: haspin family serine/threonine kinase [Amphiamblys sp. WSBS2006]|nr:MAG: haspin family serine/threonine kinase [Amphiamblys sp. WSBS2006]